MSGQKSVKEEKPAQPGDIVEPNDCFKYGADWVDEIEWVVWDALDNWAEIEPVSGGPRERIKRNLLTVEKRREERYDMNGKPSL